MNIGAALQQVQLVQYRVRGEPGNARVGQAARAAADARTSLSQGCYKPLPQETARLPPPLTGVRKLFGGFLDVSRVLVARVAQATEGILRVGDVRRTWRLVCKRCGHGKLNNRLAKPHGRCVRRRLCEQRATGQAEAAERDGHQARGDEVDMVAEPPVSQLEGVAMASALEAGTRDKHGR
eukprot:scaffold15458_cov66-Phaeocystis_antarctica.AAC.2